MLDPAGHEKIEPVSCLDQTLDLHYSDSGEGTPILFLHGWRSNRHAFLPLAENLSGRGRCLLVDLPGFGQTPIPASPWGTAEYAEFIHQFITQKQIGPSVLIGHSFGGRIAIRLATRWPEAVRGMALIASAGLKRKTAFSKRLRIGAIRSAARLAKRCVPGRSGEAIKQSLYQRIASRDYLQAGELKDIFVRVVSEDLAGLLPDIDTPVLLIWGSEDTETPPSLGRRMHELLPNSEHVELPGFDHYSILDRGRHQAGHQIGRFLEHIAKGGDK